MQVVLHAVQHHCLLHMLLFCRYGDIESIRMRSVPVKLDAKMSRRAAITTGNISKERGTAHAYIVFQQEDSAVAALASNMHVVRAYVSVLTGPVTACPWPSACPCMHCFGDCISFRREVSHTKSVCMHDVTAVCC